MSNNNETQILDGLIANTLETLENSTVTSLAGGTIYKRALKSVSFPNVLSVGGSAFSGCIQLRTVSLPKATEVGESAFDGCPVSSLALPALTSMNRQVSYNFGCGEIDLTKNIRLNMYSFRNNNNLFSVILRSSSLCALSDTRAFSYTPIAEGYGWIYVPDALVDTYKAASNWSTFASRIAPLSEYPKDPGSTITDTWAEIFAAEEDGTYSTKYSVGDTKFVKIGGIPVCMQIVKFDGDELPGSGTAKITWLCKGVFNAIAFHSTRTPIGWSTCDLKQWLNSFIYDAVETVVKEQIKPVVKTWYDGSTTQTDSENYVWIPSAREIFGGSSYENAGVTYTDFFTDNASRKKYATVLSSTYMYGWGLRSMYNSGKTQNRVVTSSGSINSGYVDTEDNSTKGNPIVFGFCT